MQDLLDSSVPGFRNGIITAFTVTALVFALWCSSAAAQSGIGSIQGTVTDPAGAVVAAAAIHVVNSGTHVAVDAKSNGAGFFQVPGLFTGDYTVTVSAPGRNTGPQSSCWLRRMP